MGSVWVGMGVCVFEKRVLDFIPAEGRFDVPDLIHALMAAGEKVHAYRSDHYWMDIGRPDDYEIACRNYAEDPRRFEPDA